jgi:hypothetical protein
MDRESLFASLSTLTGGLRPGPGARNADLEEARTLSAYEILRGRGAALTIIRPLGGSTTISTGPADSADATSIFSVADSALAGLAKNPSAFADARIFRRENPILTPLLPDSVPPWAVGWAVERTLGPFLDAAGRLYWFDIRLIHAGVQVTGGPGGTVLLVIPSTAFPAPAANYSLQAGTVWIRSKLIAADAVRVPSQGCPSGVVYSSSALRRQSLPVSSSSISLRCLSSN